jgi:tRNA(Ile)-lysidine synthase
MKALLELRHAVRPWVLQADARVAVGVSGGADSMALALALFHEATLADVEPIAVIVDHQLQEVSGEVAINTQRTLYQIGYKKVLIKKVSVDLVDGMEASARRARYGAFNEVIGEYSPDFFFLAHTRGDQAEGVLLGLARGSGARSLSGMSERNGIYIRPLLGLSGESTVQTCNENAIPYWSDPHNDDPAYTRVRVRKEILPLMAELLGPGIEEALARSAKLLKADDEALTAYAESFLVDKEPSSLQVAELAQLPLAVRSRVLRRAIYAQGAPAGSLTAEHLGWVEALVTDWHGQGVISLPGGVKVSRISGRLSLLQQGDSPRR